jgi:hypothetical protein
MLQLVLVTIDTHIAGFDFRRGDAEIGFQQQGSHDGVIIDASLSLPQVFRLVYIPWNIRIGG